jgi:hypothetical protein
MVKGCHNGAVSVKNDFGEAQSRLPRLNDLFLVANQGEKNFFKKGLKLGTRERSEEDRPR